MLWIILHVKSKSEVLIYVNLAWQTIYSLPHFLLFICIHMIIYDCIIMIQTETVCINLYVYDKNYN